MPDIDRLHAGERRYFEELVRDHGPLVLLVSEAFAVTRQEAERLFVAVWTAVYSRRKEYVGAMSFSGWVERVATTVCVERSRMMNDLPAGVAADSPGRWSSRKRFPGNYRDLFHRRLHRAMAELTEQEHAEVVRGVMPESFDSQARRGGPPPLANQHGRAIRRLGKIMEATEGELPRRHTPD